MRTRPAGMYRPLRKALEALLREFRRCSNTFPPLYHEVLRSPTVPKPPPAGMWRAFVAANAGRAGGWEEWDEFPGGKYCGRYFGSGDGLEEFRRLGESLYLVLVEFNLALDADRGYHGLLEALYEMARNHPTPLLRLKLRVWGHEGLGGPFEGTKREQVVANLGWLEDQLDQWTHVPDCGYPTSPFCERLAHGLFASAEAAVRLLLDPGSALLVGYMLDELPDLLPGTHAVKAGAKQSRDGRVEGADARPTAEERPPATPPRGDAPPFQYQLSGEYWDIRFTAGDQVEGGGFKDVVGLRHYANLLVRPHRSIGVMELTGRTEVAAAAWRTSRQCETEGDDNLPRLLEVVGSLEEQIDQAEKAGLTDTVTKLRRQQNDVEKYLRSVGRQMDASPVEKARKAVWIALTRARDKVRKSMPHFARFLERCVQPDGTGEAFVYSPLPPEPEWVGLH